MALSDNLAIPGNAFNTAEDRTELMLKVFGNEVLDAFLTTTVAKGTTMSRRIEAGKSVQFPLIGDHTAKFHTPGESLITGSYDGVINHDESVVVIDKLLASHSFIDDLEEAMLHYDIRAPYARQMGNAIARQHDELVFASAARACGLADSGEEFEAASGVDGNGPARVQIATIASGSLANITPALLLDAIRDMAAAFDKRNVPAEGRTLILRPEEYYVLASEDSNLISRDFTTANANGIDTGRVLRAYGFDLKMSNVWGNTLANQNYSTVTAGTPRNDTYTGNYSGFVALAYGQEGVGTAYLKDMATETEYITERQGSLLVAKQAFGCAVLRQSAIGVITSTDIAEL